MNFNFKITGLNIIIQVYNSKIRSIKLRQLSLKYF